MRRAFFGKGTAWSGSPSPSRCCSTGPFLSPRGEEIESAMLAYLRVIVLLSVEANRRIMSHEQHR